VTMSHSWQTAATHRASTSMIALDHLSPFATLLLQLEGRLEEVDVEPCRRTKAAHHARCFDALETAAAISCRLRTYRTGFGADRDGW
jgi:hypothetical protein